MIKTIGAKAQNRKTEGGKLVLTLGGVASVVGHKAGLVGLNEHQHQWFGG
ncbi:hypothetical protein [Vibrio sp. LaRot3]|nr:hypothetical protein [Vibrio sp. LaRot3]MDA0149571.1 hypothetical protein [Vibrio sp. LaRot3]